MLYQKLAEYPHWCSEFPEGRKQIQTVLVPWLQEQGSLTAALIRLSKDDFKVVVCREDITIAYPHEQQKLKFVKNQTSLIREVELHIYNQAVVFARSIIPLALTKQQEGSLDKLGSQPLGHLLFKEGKPRASKRDFASIEINNETIHARRTPYEYLGHQVLVSEFFLPKFLSFID